MCGLCNADCTAQSQAVSLLSCGVVFSVTALLGTSASADNSLARSNHAAVHQMTKHHHCMLLLWHPSTVILHLVPAHALKRMESIGCGWGPATAVEGSCYGQVLAVYATATKQPPHADAE
jgi:hypothetical protein